MKSLICSIAILFFFSSVSFGQFNGTWNSITGKNRFRDSMANDKLKNNVSEDSILTTDIYGKFKLALSRGSTFRFYLNSDSSQYYQYENYVLVDSAATLRGQVYRYNIVLNSDSTQYYVYENSTLIDSASTLYKRLYHDTCFNVTDTTIGGYQSLYLAINPYCRGSGAATDTLSFHSTDLNFDSTKHLYKNVNGNARDSAYDGAVITQVLDSSYMDVLKPTGGKTRVFFVGSGSSGSGGSGSLQNAFDTSVARGDNPTINTNSDGLSILMKSFNGFDVFNENADSTNGTGIDLFNGGDLGQITIINPVKGNKGLNFSSVDRDIFINTDVTGGGVNKITFPHKDSVSNLYWPLTVNGQFADVNGNINVSGGSGSGISQLGTGQYGLIDVNDSTYRVDSTVVASKTYVDALGALKQNLITTSEQVITATASQTAFTFTSVPASYNDYIIFINGLAAKSTTDYTTSGNVVTLVIARDVNDSVIFRRTK